GFTVATELQPAAADPCGYTAKFFTQLFICSRLSTLEVGITMLRSVIICPDQKLGTELMEALAATQRVEVVRTLDHYPNDVALARFLRAAAPEVVFLSVEST